MNPAKYDDEPRSLIHKGAKFVLVPVFFTFFVVAVTALSGCQTSPTKTFETKDSREKKTQQKVGDKVILIDARPAFDSSLARPNGSISLQYRDFNQVDPPFEGYLTTDLFFQARRLARLGIGPESEIIVLGRGKKGTGEEGRMAWTLRRMGIAHVKFAQIDSLHWALTNAEAPARAEVPLWKPQENKTLEVTKAEALNLIEKSRPWILDVRSAGEYLKSHDPLASAHGNAQFINIPWSDFLNSDGEPEASMPAMILAAGLKLDDNILVLDEQGVRSAGVTLILRDWGYRKATNWTGGYHELRATQLKR